MLLLMMVLLLMMMIGRSDVTGGAVSTGDTEIREQYVQTEVTPCTSHCCHDTASSLRVFLYLLVLLLNRLRLRARLRLRFVFVQATMTGRRKRATLGIVRLQMLRLLLFLLLMMVVAMMEVEVLVVVVVVVVMIGRGRRERLSTVTMHRRARRVTVGSFSLRQRGALTRLFVIPTLSNRVLSRPQLDILSSMVVVLGLMLMVLLLLVGELGNLLLTMLFPLLLLLLLLLLLPVARVTTPVATGILFQIYPFSKDRIVIIEGMQFVRGAGIVSMIRRNCNNHSFDATRLHDRAIFNFLLSRLQHAHRVPAFVGFALSIP